MSLWIENVTRLVALVDEKLAADVTASRPDAASYEACRQRAAYGKAIIDDLAENEGARFSDRMAPTLTMSGIKSSCTAGHLALLRNWQAAARRRIEQHQLGRAA